MAIGAGAAGAWSANAAATQSFASYPTHATGDMLILIAACKASPITSIDPALTSVSGWTRFASFADGTTNSGNGTGSVHQAIWYKEATSNNEALATVVWDGGAAAVASAPGLLLALSFTKGASESWAAPVAEQKATNSATSISVTMDSNPGITAGDWGIVIHTTRDDSALTVPSWSATGLTLAAVVEYPATAIASGTSNDMAGDCAYRSVTSGDASAAPVCTGTQAAGETGVTGFVRLRASVVVPRVPRRERQVSQLLAH